MCASLQHPSLLTVNVVFPIMWCIHSPTMLHVPPFFFLETHRQKASLFLLPCFWLGGPRPTTWGQPAVGDNRCTWSVRRRVSGKSLCWYLGTWQGGFRLDSWVTGWTPCGFLSRSPADELPSWCSHLLPRKNCFPSPLPCTPGLPNSGIWAHLIGGVSGCSLILRVFYSSLLITCSQAEGTSLHFFSVTCLLTFFVSKGGDMAIIFFLLFLEKSFIKLQHEYLVWEKGSGISHLIICFLYLFIYSFACSHSQAA